MVPSLQQDPADETHEADTIKQAIQKAQHLEYTNGMATAPVTVDRETETLSVIRKAGSLDHREIFLLIARPTAGYVEPSVNALQDDIKEAADLYGDINVKMKRRDHHEGSFDCTLPVDLFE